MGDAGEIAQHHAETVIERDRNADEIPLAEALSLPDEIAIVEDIVVRQRRSFWSARRAAGELDVDGIVELQLLLQLRQYVPMTIAAHPGHGVEAEEAANLVGTDADQRLERGDARCLQMAGRAVLALGHQLAQDRNIVVRLETLGGDK